MELSIYAGYVDGLYLMLVIVNTLASDANSQIFSQTYLEPS
jgi:hypothetical protein